MRNSGSSSIVSRKLFLGGLGGGALLAGCAGITKTALPNLTSPRTPNNLAALMKKAGVLSAHHQGFVYKADGSVHRETETCGVAPLDGSRHAELCLNPTPTPAPLKEIGSVTSYAYPSGLGTCGVQWATSGKYYVGPSTGPRFDVDVGPGCSSDPFGDVVDYANKAVDFIKNNTAFSTASIGATARAAIADWTGTGEGIAASAAAALEFLGILFAGMSVADILVLAGAIGLSIWALKELYDCIIG